MFELCKRGYFRDLDFEVGAAQGHQILSPELSLLLLVNPLASFHFAEKANPAIQGRLL